MNIIIGKSDIAALGCEGCKKKFVCNIANNDPANRAYIEGKLGVNLPEKDPPAIIDNSGGEGEKGILLLLLSQGKTIVTMDSDSVFAGRYVDGTMSAPYVLFDNHNMMNLRTEPSERIGKAQYLTDDISKCDSIRSIARRGVNYLYQVSISPDFMDIVPCLVPSAGIVYAANTISVSKRNLIRPDLIEIIPRTLGKPILTSQLTRGESDGRKYILKVCDIKTSEFTNSFFFELAYYMLLLRGWIDRNGLNDEFDVSYEATIFPYDVVNETIRQEDGWNMEFSLVKDRVFHMLNVVIPNIITKIESGDTSLIKYVKRSSRCQVCDYYGGQFEGELFDKYKARGTSGRTDYEMFLSNPAHNYCKYCLASNNDINILPGIKTSNIEYLQDKGIYDLTALETQLRVGTAINDNAELMSNSEGLLAEIDVHGTGTVQPKVRATNTISQARAQLQLYTIIRQDSQRRTLSYGISYSINVYDVDTTTVRPGMHVDASGKLSENNIATPYLVEIDKPDFNYKLPAFIDYVIKIKEILENYRDIEYTSYGQKKKVSFGIFYWGKKTYDAFRDNLQELLEYLANTGGLAGLYPSLSATTIRRKENLLMDAVNKFADLFSEEEVTYYERILKCPLFDLKSIYSELAAVDTNFSYNLIDVYNAVFGTSEFNYHYRPDSDNYSAYTFDSWFGIDRTTEPLRKNSVQNELTNRDKQHFFYLSKLYSYLYEMSSPLSSILKKGELPTLGMVVNNPGITDWQFLYLYLFQKTNAAYDQVEVDENHSSTDMKKQYGGDSILLERELTATEIAALGISVSIGERVYLTKGTAENANLDESSFGLTIYPASNFGDTYKKITNNPAYSSCLYVDVDLPPWKNFHIYTEVLKCDITYFDATTNAIRVRFDQDVIEVMSELESRYGYDFSNNVYIEKTFMDFWSKRLKDTILDLQKPTRNLKKQMIMSPTMQRVNSIVQADVDRLIIPNILSGEPLLLDDSQKNAIVTMYNDNLSLLWGPPGTGKSHTLGHLLLLELISRDSCNILLMGNYTPTDNLVNSLLKIIDKYGIDNSIRQKLDIVRFHSNSKEMEDIINVTGVSERKWKLDDGNLHLIRPFTIFTSTPDQLARLAETSPKMRNSLREIDSFDIIIVDEASQMDVGHFLPCLLRARATTNGHSKIVIAGDDKQLQPIRKEEIKGTNAVWFGSIYNYFKAYEVSPRVKLIAPVALDVSRRSNHCIIDFIRQAFEYRPTFISANPISKIEYTTPSYPSSYIESVLNPDVGIALLEYDDGLSSQKNNFEIDKVTEMVLEVWNCGIRRFGNDFRKFFEEGVGIVIPHTAQRTAIRKKLFDMFKVILLGSYNDSEIKAIINGAVDTVERFQGQERDLIISGYVLGNDDAISAEEAFIYDKCRLNVIISRAKYKAVIFASRELLSNISNDIEIIELQKSFQMLKDHCDTVADILEPSWKNGKLYLKTI
ncbi:DEAD/DEAH box helicase [Roseburia inulinivorans]